MNKVEYIIIHCSATMEGKAFFAKDIDRWHKANGWKGIGYHFVINLDGEIETGRPLDADEWIEANEVGAHAYGYNSRSIGICYIGGCDANMKPKDTRTPQQKESLIQLIKSLRQTHKSAKIIGHNEVEKNKACPSFDVQKWIKAIGLI